MVEMFQNYNIEVKKEELDKMYKIVDVNCDNALNYKEFKECAVSSTANYVFS